MDTSTPIIDSRLPSNWKPRGMTAEEYKKYKNVLLDGSRPEGQWLKELQSYIKEKHGQHVPIEYLADEQLHGQSYDLPHALRSGLQPKRYAPDNNRYHWGSVAPDGVWLKAPNHPTAWMEVFMGFTKKDPNEMGIKNKEQAEEYLRRNGIKPE